MQAEGGWMMDGDRGPTEDNTPGFHATYEAPDVGPEHAVICPRCHAVVGAIGEREEREVFCAHCQTVYRVAGREAAPPQIERLRQRVVIDGEGHLGQALRGEHPDVPPWWGSAPAQAFLWLILFLALLIALSLW